MNEQRRTSLRSLPIRQLLLRSALAIAVGLLCAAFAPGLPVAACLAAALATVAATSVADALRPRTRYFHTVLINHEAPMLLVDPDSGRIVDGNDAACRFYGYSCAQMAQMHINDINILPEAEIRAEMNRAAAEERNFFVFEHRCANGELRTVEVHSSPTEVDGKILLLSIIYDISERKRTEAALAHSEAFNASLLEAIPLPVFYKNLEGRYSGCNRAFAALTGKKKEEIIDRTVFELWPQQFAGIYHDRDLDLFEERKPLQIYESQLSDGRNRVRDVIFHKALTFDRNGKPSGLIGVILDITDRKQNEQKFLQLAMHDPLTGLPNRHLLLERLQHAMATSNRNGLHGALLFLDLDDFKSINDQHGHHVGDRLLIEVAQRLKSCVRDHDTVTRLAGDEFVIVLEALDRIEVNAILQARAVAEKIRLRLAEAYAIDDYLLTTAASIGITLFKGREVGAEALIKQADQAMYEAKTSGRNVVRFYNRQPSPASP